MTDRFTVLHFTNTLVRAGVEEHVLTLLRGLDRTYFRLHLACTPEVADKLGADLPDDVELTKITLDGLRDVGGAWELVRLLRTRRPHVLHSHLFQASRCASPIGWICGTPVIVETPHLREQWRKGWLKGSYAIDRAVARCVNHFVAVSEAQRRYLVEEKGLRPEKVVVIRNGADLRRFEAARQSPDGWRARLGLEEGDPVVVVLARLDPQKGHHVLLDALPQVCNEFPRLRVFCVGDGTLRQELCQRVRDLALDNCVRFVGYQTQTADWLALADFTVLPSHFEGLPIAAIESLAMEKPMVATAVDGTAEVVLDGKTGLTVPPGQPNRLAEAICRLLRDSDLRRRLGRAGRDWVKQHFSQEEQVRKTGDLYLQALERCAGRVESPRTSPPRGEACASSAKTASDGQRATSG